ncbi:MAG TPA: hypothetical protein VK101_02755 [Limnochordia bacterium]|nr:hypothetical protein [Limnochordia bacterium]
MKRLLAALGFALPPLAFFGWLLWTVAGVRGAAIPAFGPVEPYVAALRWSLFAKMALGASLLIGWTGCWTYLRRRRNKKTPAQRGYSRGAKVASPGRS